MKHGDHKSEMNVAADLCSVTHNTNISLIFHLSLGFWHRENE